MNQRALLFKNSVGKTRESYYGFSWTAVVFTPFLQLYRKDLVGFFIYFGLYFVYRAWLFPSVIELSSLTIAYAIQALLWLFAGFTYNKLHIMLLMRSGYRPVLKEDATFLKAKGF